MAIEITNQSDNCSLILVRRYLRLESWLGGDSGMVRPIKSDFLAILQSVESGWANLDCQIRSIRTSEENRGGRERAKMRGDWKGERETFYFVCVCVCVLFLASYADWPVANFPAAVKNGGFWKMMFHMLPTNTKRTLLLLLQDGAPSAPLVGVLLLLLLLLHHYPSLAIPLVGGQLVTWSNLGEVPPPPPPPSLPSSRSDGGLFRGGRWKYPRYEFTPKIDWLLQQVKNSFIALFI